MNCSDFQMIALELARNRLLDAATRKQGLAHAEDCESCAARMAGERALLACVRPVIAELACEEAPARVETELLAAFRAQNAVTISPAVKGQSRQAPSWSRWRLAAIAAGILLLISTVIVFLKTAITPSPRHEASAVLPGPVSTPGPIAKSSLTASLSSSHDHRAARQVTKSQKHIRRRVAGDASDHASDDSDAISVFFLLREGDDLRREESLRLVRVELPGSALSAIGVEVDPITAKTPVEAEVMLGQDGLARAIRFVRWNKQKETTDE
ncbi:MAG: hypothetical protein J2P41_18540 [Blastocatellia bacterium]|nr:hypothetical protein [Blastocatellia bacterium]